MTNRIWNYSAALEEHIRQEHRWAHIIEEEDEDFLKGIVPDFVPDLLEDDE